MGLTFKLIDRIKGLSLLRWVGLTHSVKQLNETKRLLLCLTTFKPAHLLFPLAESEVFLGPTPVIPHTEAAGPSSLSSRLLECGLALCFKLPWVSGSPVRLAGVGTWQSLPKWLGPISYHQSPSEYKLLLHGLFLWVFEIEVRHGD